MPDISTEKIIELLKTKGPIEATKYVKDTYKVGLKEAKKLVDDVIANNPGIVIAKDKTTAQTLLGMAVVIVIIWAGCKMCGGDDSTKAALAQKEQSSTAPVELVKVPDEKILDFEVIQKKEDWGGRKLSDVYAIITEKPAGKTEIDATVRLIAKNYLKESKHIPDHLTVWLYTSKVQATDPNLRSEFIVQYWKNFNSKEEKVSFNNERIDMLLGHGDRFTVFNKVNKALSDKGVDFCQLHILHKSWMRWSDEKSREKYDGNDDRQIAYAEELYNKEVNEFRKKFKVSEALWNESMIYGDYACDISTE